MSDTSPEAEEIVRAAIRRLSSAERMRQALELSEQLRELSLMQLRRRYPGHSTLQLAAMLTGNAVISTTQQNNK